MTARPMARRPCSPGWRTDHRDKPGQPGPRRRHDGRLRPRRDAFRGDARCRRSLASPRSHVSLRCSTTILASPASSLWRRYSPTGRSRIPKPKGTVRRLWTRTTLLFRTEAAREVGDFVDLPGQLGEVIDWLARSRDLGHRHAMVEEILAMRRIRPGSLSSELDADRSRGYLFAVRNAIERRKALAAERKTGSDS